MKQQNQEKATVTRVVERKSVVVTDFMWIGNADITNIF